MRPIGAAIFASAMVFSGVYCLATGHETAAGWLIVLGVIFWATT